jgi:hypothetical protein
MQLPSLLLLAQAVLAGDTVIKTQSFPAKAVRRVIARVEAGTIKITATRSSELTAKAVKPADSEGHCDLHLLLKNGVLELIARKPKGKSDVCDGGFVVSVPPTATLEAQAGSGDIEAAGLAKSVRARTGSGGIRLKDVLGQVYAVTGSGDISAKVGSAAFDARSGSGNVRVTLGAATGLVSARTGSGNVEVSLPKGATVRLRAKTGSGKLNSAFPHDPKAPLVVEASTGSGDITVKPAQP